MTYQEAARICCEVRPEITFLLGVKDVSVVENKKTGQFYLQIFTPEVTPYNYQEIEKIMALHGVASRDWVIETKGTIVLR